jgi:hypothetical protein
MTPVNPDRIPKRQHYRVVPDRSALLIEVATSVGPVTFGAVGLEGFVRVAVRGAGLDLAATPIAHLELQLRDLTSGNSAYDGELQRHIDARRYPAAHVDLHHVHRVGDSSSDYLVAGDITFRGITQSVEGYVTVNVPEAGLVRVSGTKSLDIRLFEIPPPTLFMLKIDPEVTLSLQLEARLSP